MKKFLWFLTSLGVLGFTIGTLIGVSASPVVGITITAVIGTAATVFSVLNERKANKGQVERITLNFIGGCIIIFSTMLLVGCLTGINYKYNAQRPGEKNFVWRNNSEITIEEALDWIRIEEVLKRKGYSDDQIRSLYEIAKAHPTTVVKDEEVRLLSRLLINAKKDKSREKKLQKDVVQKLSEKGLTENESAYLVQGATDSIKTYNSLKRLIEERKTPKKNISNLLGDTMSPLNFPFIPVAWDPRIAEEQKKKNGNG